MADQLTPGSVFPDLTLNVAGGGQLSLPSEPGLWYADGQILGEDYVWTSFKMSKMGHAGVTCMDCHDPHTAAVKLPVENNAICMQCHAGGLDGATVIDPTKHSFHGAEIVHEIPVQVEGQRVPVERRCWDRQWAELVRAP